MTRTLASGILALFLITPFVTSAATLDELRTQLNTLLAQIATLTGQSGTVLGTAKWCPNLTRNVQQGSRGADVLELQKWLIEEGYLAAGSGTGSTFGGNATGYYGPMTVDAVKKFQCKEGVVCSGTPATTGYGAVGPATRAAIARVCSAVAQCVPLPSETRTLACPAGQTGIITETRTSKCALGATTPTWSEWTVSSTTCVKTVPTPVPTSSGWDYNLTKKCLRTTGNPGDVNYFAVNDECPAEGKHWTIAVQSENAPGAGAPGPTTRSFLVNGPNSPVTLNWLPHQSDLGQNWTVNMKTDHVTYPHPNGDGYFTWFSMMDHIGHDGGPLPEPMKLVTEHTISYNTYVPTADASARLVAGAQFFYGGKAHLIEINLAMQQWGDDHPDPEAVLVRPDWTGDGSLEYVTLDGAAIGLTVTPGVEKKVRIEWGPILARMIEKGWFSPIGNQPSVTQAVSLSTETKNRAVADLWHTDFRVSSN